QGGAAGANAPPPDVRIDWNGLARRARRITVPGTTLGALTPAPEGHAVAMTIATAGAGGRGALGDAGGGIQIVDVESGQLTRVPPAPPAGEGRGGAAGGPTSAGLGSGMAFSRDGRTLYFRSGEHLFAGAVPANAGAAGGQAA